MVREKRTPRAGKLLCGLFYCPGQHRPHVANIISLLRNVSSRSEVSHIFAASEAAFSRVSGGISSCMVRVG